ncbi:acyl-ACP thioesterase domain-containing protein [Gordonia sp. (in: high G+C Gram-positive bacteria)]|uniref:acyl-ACP thioesterase domain-containing protein n=1 Tax=unclassified Gordonia (in: high G+C Gram-positive bacteria) TaxID=2657482 RepID=UPI00262651D6|nr:acyl-ACP thioesterase domain-containing protein [Gordonia sp. (in: high G+C Gram-positive bacteria)]
MIGEPLSPRLDPELRRELLSEGAVFTSTWPVRGDDISHDRRLKFDGVARCLQDVGQDHLAHIGHLEIHPHWVLRRTVIEMHALGEQPDQLTAERWAAQAGSRWFTARIDIDGERGTRIATEGFWINFNVDTLTPSALSDTFRRRIGGDAVPGRLRWKKWLDPVPHPDAVPVPFLLRVCDLDLIEHVNNAVYWTALEEALATQADLRERLPLRAVVEHDSPLQLADAPRLLAHRDGDVLSVWLMAGERTAATMSVEALPVSP